ncbi:hemicentin-1 [Orussus abietinus]|uniref:hemicentin-1 n=1 Tax=Orussus abietinus TaxID=222816 RepID=UPI000C715B5B|nr:hemicentin-1 [Orussus abietinus]
MAIAQCAVVQGDLPVDISWSLNGRPVGVDLDTRDVLVSRSGRRVGTLTIDSVAARHVGEYSCTARNAAGSATHSAVLSVNVAPEIAPFTIAENPANWGDSISVVCAVLKGDLPIDISWVLNGEPIGPGNADVNVLATTKRNSILSIDSVAARHAGEYTCLASNRAGATSHSSILAVNVGPQIAPFSMGEGPANWGDTVTATCTVIKGDQPMSIEWALNGVPISGEYSDVTVATGKRVSLLTIEAVSARHSGEYTCSAANEAGGTSYSAALAVNVAPHISPFSISEGPANWGDAVSATCTIVKGDFPARIVWTFDGRPADRVHPDLTINRINRHMSVLSIESVAARHAGEYTCVAANRAGNATHSAVLVVNVAPQIAPFTMSDLPANWGEAVSAVCTVLKGDLPIEVSWALNGVPLAGSDRYPDVSVSSTGKRVSLLTIEAVSARHAGEYTCTAANLAGATSYSATLAVNVAPQIAPFSIGDVPVNWGERISAVCNIVKGDYPIRIRWSHDGEEISPETRPDVAVTKTGEMISLISIDAVTARHAGEYTCVASNDAGSTSRSAILSVNAPVAPQIAPFSIGDEVANWGEQVSAVCSILKGDSPIEIQWSLNGEEISPETHPDISIAKTGKMISVLSVASVTARHAGEYTCVAGNLAGTTSRSATLSVNVAPQIAPISFGEDLVNWGEQASAVCSVLKGDFPIDIRWSLNGEEISQESHPDVSVTRTGKKTSLLSIDSVTAHHAGEYTCVVGNLAGTTSRSATLSVNVAPQIAPITFGEELVNWGEQASAICSVLKGDFPIDIRWSLNGEEISQESHPDVSVTRTGKKTSLLSIDSVTARHAGEYTCVAGNLAGTTSRTAALSVNVAPLIAPISFGAELVNWGEQVTAVCSVLKGDLPIDIRWSLDGEEISPETHPDVAVTRTGKKSSMLGIDAVTARHAGEYTCVAGNLAGTTSHSATLSVNVAPLLAPISFGAELVNWGEQVSAVCSVLKGDFPIEIRWSLNGEEISPETHPDVAIIKTGNMISLMSVTSVTARHAGEYTCVAGNLAGSTSHSATLSVNVAPQVSPISFGDEPVNWGEQVSATCSILKGDFPVEIQWSLNGEEISQRTRSDVVITKVGSKTSVLTIDSVTARHAGGVHLRRRKPGREHDSVGDPFVAPQLAPLSFGDEPANSGEQVSATCSVLKGDSPIDIQWNLNGERISSGTHPDVLVTKSGTKISLLSIDAVTARHAGEYTCVASNLAGTISRSATLAVNGTVSHRK